MSLISVPDFSLISRMQIEGRKMQSRITQQRAVMALATLMQHHRRQRNGIFLKSRPEQRLVSVPTIDSILMFPLSLTVAPSSRSGLAARGSSSLRIHVVQWQSDRQCTGGTSPCLQGQRCCTLDSVSPKVIERVGRNLNHMMIRLQGASCLI